jgi:hypothetical protein
LLGKVPAGATLKSITEGIHKADGKVKVALHKLYYADEEPDNVMLKDMAKVEFDSE